MSERRDNTTEHDDPSPKEREPPPGSYYYDDATGYEIYDPAKDDEDEGDERGATKDDKHSCHTPFVARRLRARL